MKDNIEKNIFIFVKIPNSQFKLVGYDVEVSNKTKVKDFKLAIALLEYNALNIKELRKKFPDGKIPDYKVYDGHEVNSFVGNNELLLNNSYIKILINTYGVRSDVDKLNALRRRQLIKNEAPSSNLSDIDEASIIIDLTLLKSKILTLDLSIFNGLVVAKDEGGFGSDDNVTPKSSEMEPSHAMCALLGAICGLTIVYFTKIKGSNIKLSNAAMIALVGATTCAIAG